ncbi:MAG: DNA-directed RNA polymerase subunit alpha C-terminal domain-containing protein, partial [Verrucomicrobiota bacterium]
MNLIYCSCTKNAGRKRKFAVYLIRGSKCAMFRVSPVQRKTIDNWTIKESGLSTRIINSVNAKNVKFVGDLRPLKDADLLELRSLGQISLNQIRDFFTLCNKISNGTKTFESVEEVLQIFLDEDEYDVLSARYGLLRPDLEASRSYQTLQQIGNEKNRTRERIRQVEDLAKANLRKNLAVVCLQPFVEFFVDFIKAYGYSIACTDLRSLRGERIVSGLNPCSVLLLLADLFPAEITWFNRFFSVLKLDHLELLDDAARKSLEGRAGLSTIEHVIHSVTLEAVELEREHAAKTLDTLLRHNTNVATTTDGHYTDDSDRLNRTGVPPLWFDEA